MRILLFDIDTLRPDHMGCYGYARPTTPAMDKIAAEGVTFDNYYCPNAPCLPSRASLISGQYGIHTGVLGHGGTAADMRLQGYDRSFTDNLSDNGLFTQFIRSGIHTVSFSTFADRHSSWWFKCGFAESYDVGKKGGESAEEVTPLVLDWLDRKGNDDNWLLHIHYWDPHTPYRAPAEVGDPFADAAIPDSHDWITDEIFAEHRRHIGPHGANEINMWNDSTSPMFPRHPGKLESTADVKTFIDNYDTGILFTDNNISQVVDKVKEMGLYGDDLAIIITSDHGENMGELGLYGEHGTACEATCRIPMIIKWPGCKAGSRVGGFHDNVDLLPTVRDLLGRQNRVPKAYKYDGVSYAQSVLSGEDCGKESLVLSQCAHVCQRSARFDDFIYIRTIHGGYHLFEKEMLFNVKDDPHMLSNLAGENPELCAKGAKIILDWTDDMMKSSHYDVDPMWTVVREGGPFHSRGAFANYLKRLEGTDREFGIQLLREMYPDMEK